MFQQLFAMLQDGDVFLLTLTREDDDLRVNLIPKGPESSNTAALLPLSILATPVELDDPEQVFASAIQHYGEVRHGVLEAIGIRQLSFDVYRAARQQGGYGKVSWIKRATWSPASCIALSSIFRENLLAIPVSATR